MLIFGATVGFFVFFLLASLLSAGTDDSGCFLFNLMIVCVIAGGYAAAKLGHDKLAVPFFPLGFDAYHAIDLQFNQNHNDSVLNGWTVVIRDNDWADKVQVNGFDVHTVEEKENTMEDEKLILGNVPEPYYDKKAATRNGLLSGAIAGGVIGIILLIITTSSGMFLIGLVTLLVMAGLGALGGMIIAVKMGEGAGANGLEGFKKGTLFIGALPALVIGILPSVIILFVVALIMG